MIALMPALAASVQELYRVFARYPRPERVSPCTFCWSEEEIEVLKSTPLRQIEREFVRRLLWETADHWENVETYKHYLPRILEAMTPSLDIEDMYPTHIFETLQSLRFAHWPVGEREAVLGFMAALDATLPSIAGLDSESSQAEWRTAAENLRTGAS
jgi:hypothetical protein